MSTIFWSARVPRRGRSPERRTGVRHQPQQVRMGDGDRRATASGRDRVLDLASENVGVSPQRKTGREPLSTTYSRTHRRCRFREPGDVVPRHLRHRASLPASNASLERTTGFGQGTNRVRGRLAPGIVRTGRTGRDAACVGPSGRVPAGDRRRAGRKAGVRLLPRHRGPWHSPAPPAVARYRRENFSPGPDSARGRSGGGTRSWGHPCAPVYEGCPMWSPRSCSALRADLPGVVAAVTLGVVLKAGLIAGTMVLVFGRPELSGARYRRRPDRPAVGRRPDRQGADVAARPVAADGVGVVRRPDDGPADPVPGGVRLHGGGQRGRPGDQPGAGGDYATGLLFNAVLLAASATASPSAC